MAASKDIRVRVLGYLERRGVIENQAELAVLDGDFCEREPALAQLAAEGFSRAQIERMASQNAAYLLKL